MNKEDGIVLEVENLKKYFRIPQGLVKAVDEISFSVKEGEMFGLVGESGSGKSTTGFAIAGARAYTPTSGKIFYKGQDITKPARDRPAKMRKEISMVFQDPASSLNPSQTVKQIVSLPLKVHQSYEDDEELRKRVENLSRRVGLPPEDYLHRASAELGGGDAQLVAIARALAVDPSLIIFDEPTSALDVSLQAKVLAVVNEIHQEYGLSSIFITHNLGLVRNVTTRVAIMYLGKIFEKGPTKKVFEEPVHPYTQMLFSSIPVITKQEEGLKPKAVESTGEIPSPVNPPSGCRFHTRCPFVTDVCRSESPDFIEIGKNHKVACHTV